MTSDLPSSGRLLFVAQALLDTWVGQARIDVDGTSLAIAGDPTRQRRYALEPAVRFLGVAGGGDDPHGLVARVKSLDQIREMGGEPMADSVVVGDVAYEVEPGYLAEAGVVEAASRAPSSPAAPPGALPRDLEDRRQEAEALARFLLDNLS